MTFSKAWQQRYADGYEAQGFYPALQKLVVWHVVEASRVLELGCGLGANIPFLRELGLGEYHAIEGSSAAVETLHARHPELRDRIVCADFTREIPFAPGFDLVIDRAAVAHNDLASIERCLALVWDALKPGGLFISSDWFSASHSEIGRGDPVDTNTRDGYRDGQFSGVGYVHFSSERELQHLFSRFEGVWLEERISRRRQAFGYQAPEVRHISTYFDGADYDSAVWDLVVRKPA